MSGKRREYLTEEGRDITEIVKKRATKNASPFECVTEMHSKDLQQEAEQHSESTNDSIEGFEQNKQEQLKARIATSNQTKQVLSKNEKET